MSRGIYRLVPSLLVAWTWLVASTHADEFFLQFRDGSIVRANIKTPSLTWTEFEVGKESETSVLPFERIGTLSLAEMPVTQRLANVRKLLDDLAAEDYLVREAATEALRTSGADFLDVINLYLESPDPEVRWRVKGIVRSLSGGNQAARRVDFDQLVLARENGTVDPPSSAVLGDSKDFVLEAELLGQSVEIPRQQLLALWRPGFQPASGEDEHVIGERLGSDQIDRFPANAIRVGFGTGPDGAELVKGTIVDDLYIPWGVRFSTSIENGNLCVFQFNVGGAASGLPAAGGQQKDSEEENYKGVTTIRFHAPGRPDVPATVSMFGCYMAIVQPQGTLVRFFDLQGQLISELATTRKSWEFIGFRSPRPIARVEIHPTRLDSNYAIDDVYFDPPQVASESGNGQLVRVSLLDGQQVQAAKLTIDEQVAVLSELTIGVAEVRIPLDQIGYLSPITDSYDPLQAEPTTWVQTTRGDRVIVTLSPNGARLSANPEISFPQDELRAIWGSRQADVEIGLAQSSNEPVWLDAENQPYPIQDFAIGEGVLQGKSTSSGWAEPVESQSAPIVILGPAPNWNSEGAYIRLIDGQLWILDGERAKFVRWEIDGVVIQVDGVELRLPLLQIAAIKFTETE